MSDDTQFTATEYADFQCWKSIMTPFAKSGWTTTSTSDFSNDTPDYCGYDAKVEKDGNVRYIVELKARRDDITPTTFNDFSIDLTKFRNLQVVMAEDGVDAYIVELFPKYGQGYVWHLDVLSEPRITTMTAPTKTLSKKPAKPKQMVLLSHLAAKVVTFPPTLWKESYQKAIDNLQKLNE